MKSEMVLIIFHECVGNGARTNSEATTMGGFHVTIHEDDLCSFKGRMSAMGIHDLVDLECSQQVNSYRGADQLVIVVG